MIKNVIKRDGRVEEFSAEKINSWIQWSEKTVIPKDFNWSTIVLKTISTLPEQVTTKELQEALIRECLNQETWEGSRMAGRLYASALPKELYESRKHPTIKELHVRLYEKGLIIDTSAYFTNEEYDEINKMLVHRRDYTYSHYAIKQLIQKYSMQDRVLKQSYETPQFIYMRVAMQTYINYRGSDRLSKLKSLYEDLSHQRINVPTPYFSYSLTVKPNTASCFLPHTLVDLETCRKKISEVEVGSKVLTHTGQFKTVIDKFSRIYSGKMVQINTVASYINEFESTYNHRIYAIKATSPELIKQTSKCKPEWIEADHIRVGDYIKLGVNLDVYDKPITIWDIIHNNYLVKDYVIENDKIKKIILTGKDRGQSFKKHPETNNINIFDKELFRLIGYYLAEGCITKPERQNSENFQLTFGTKEEVFINDAINIVYHLFGIKLSRYDNPSDNSTKLQTYNKPLCALMLELCNTGFDKKYLHDLILKAPRELQEELLVGVIRGDGCSTISGFRLSLTNKELIYQLKNIALRCNIHISMSGGIQSTRYPDKKPSCILQFNVDGLSDFAKKVNKNIDKIRKNKSCSGLHIVFREDGVFARAREISSYYVENQEVWDLTVEDDHSFIVNSLTVHNCSVLTCGDEAESIGVLNTLAYTLTTAGAGVGAHMKTRSLGDGIRNGSVKHAGKVPYYRAFANVMRSSMQASRSGASTMHFPVFDPEVEILMGLKNPLSTLVNKVRESDYAISINKPFVKRMVTDKPFWLFSYKDNPELYEEFYHADSNKFDRHLEEFVIQNPEKVVEVKASDLFSNGMNNRLSTGRLYVHFADTANKQTPYKDTIYSSNLCVAPETLILTSKGYFPIQELENEEVEVWNGQQWSKTTVRKTGTSQKLIKVITDSGQELSCTPYHKFYIQKSYSADSIEKIDAKDLQPGDKLIKFDLPVIDGNLKLDKAYINGFYSGDGCLTKSGQRIYLYHEKRKLKDLFGDKEWLIQENQNREITHFNDLKDKFFVPSAEYTVESRLEWLAGISDSDGSIYKNGDNQQLVISSIEKEFLKEIQLMLQTLGVNSKIKKLYEEGYQRLPANDGSGELKEFWCQTSYRLLITSKGLHKLIQLGFKTHRLELKSHVPQRDANRFIIVESIKDENRIDDTYCFTEPLRNMGMFNGILTGQCMEISNVTKPFKNHAELYSDTPEGVVGFCNLAGINIPHIKDDKEYEQACYNALMMIESGIENTKFVFPALNANLKDYRSAGVGVVGLAYLMAKKHMFYTTQEGRDFIFEQSEKFAYFVTKAAIKITEELGPCKVMDNNKYAEGWLPMDDASPAALALTTKSLSYDWDSLREDMKRLGGLRFSTLMAHMPAESSSIACSLTNSIYPIRELSLTKTAGDSSNKWIAPEATKLAKWYEIAWNMSNEHHINNYALWQIFNDQSISADLYADRTKTVNIPMSQLFKEIVYSAKLGLKSHYYYNTLTDSKESTEFLETRIEDNTEAELEDFDDSEGCDSGGCTL